MTHSNDIVDLESWAGLRSTCGSIPLPAASSGCSCDYIYFTRLSVLRLRRMMIENCNLSRRLICDITPLLRVEQPARLEHEGRKVQKCCWTICAHPCLLWTSLFSLQIIHEERNKKFDADIYAPRKDWHAWRVSCEMWRHAAWYKLTYVSGETDGYIMIKIDAAGSREV